MAFFFILAALVSDGARAATSLVTLNQMIGEIWTCTCFMRPHGGLHRILNYLEKEKKKNPELLILSNGNLVLSPFESEEPTKWSKKSALIAKAFKRLNAKAVNVSYADIKLGVDALKTLGTQGNIPWVSTNIVDKNSKPIFTPFIDLKVGKDKFRILGLTEAKMHTSKEYKVLDVKKTLKAELSKIDKETIPVVIIDFYSSELGFSEKGPGRDMVVVGGYPYDEEASYYKDVPGIYALIGGAKVKKIPRFDFDVKDGSIVNPKYSAQTLDIKFDKGAPLKKELDALSKELGL